MMEKRPVKRRDPKVFLFGAIAAFAVAAIAGVSYLGVQWQPQPAADQSSELSRLASLAVSGSLGVEDLSGIKSRLSGDPALGHELEELEAMVRYGEMQHAVHTIGFIDGFLKTGEQISCPEHELSHYYVFMKHGEAGLAEHALEHAKEQIPGWEPKAREFDERYPSGMPFDDRLADIESRISSIESGGPLASDEEALALADRAICVGAGPVHEDHESEPRAEEPALSGEEEGHA